MTKKTDLQLIDITQAAKALDVSTKTLRRWDEDKVLPAIRLTARGRRMYKKSDIEKFVQKGIRT
jgi:excisionase family DNA binding protein